MSKNWQNQKEIKVYVSATINKLQAASISCGIAERPVQDKVEVTIGHITHVAQTIVHGVHGMVHRPGKQGRLTMSQ